MAMASHTKVDQKAFKIHELLLPRGKFKNVSICKKSSTFHRLQDMEMLRLRQGWNGLFEPEMASCDGRRVVTARLCAQNQIKFPIPKVMINNRVEMAICFRKGSSNFGSWMEATFSPLKINSGVVVKNKSWMGE